MTPEERQELLDTGNDGAKMLDFPKMDTPQEVKPEVEPETDSQEQDITAPVVAFKEGLTSIREILRSNIGICRKIYDPRVMLEAAEIGMGNDELEEMKERMQIWTDAVLETRDGETYDQRRLRLRLLYGELYRGRDSSGCQCKGTGLVFTVGDIWLSDDKVTRNVEHYLTCECTKGEAKRIAIANMGKPKNVTHGQGKRPNDSDGVSF